VKGIVRTYNKPVALEFAINAKQPTKVYLMVRDKNNPKNQFTNRYNTVQGQRSLIVRMPISPDVAEFIIQDENQLVNQDEQTHLREDYEFYTHDGILEIIYACTCDMCHQSYSFNKTINLTEVME